MEFKEAYNSGHGFACKRELYDIAERLLIEKEHSPFYRVESQSLMHDVNIERLLQLSLSPR